MPRSGAGKFCSLDQDIADGRDHSNKIRSVPFRLPQEWRTPCGPSRKQRELSLMEPGNTITNWPFTMAANYSKSATAKDPCSSTSAWTAHAWNVAFATYANAY